MIAELASVAILSLASWPLLRLLGIAPFRRWYGCIAIRAGVLLGTYAVAVAWLWFQAPRVLPLAAAVAAIALAAERLRSRASHGKRRGLPPGRLGIVPRGPWVDEAFFRNEARRYGPVFKTSQFLRPACCVIGPRLGLALLREHAAHLEPPPVRFNAFIPGGFIRYMQPADHARYRAMLQAALAPRAIETADTASRDIMRGGLANIAAASEAAGDAGIHPRPYVEDLLLEALAHLFLGIGPGSRDMARLHLLYREIDIRKVACRRSSAEFDAATGISKIIRQRADVPLAARERPSVLAALARNHPDAFAGDTLVLNLVYLIQVGRGDLSGLLLWILKLLVDNDEWLSRLREAHTGEARGADSLSHRIVKETLRLEQSEYLYRKVTSGIRFAGFVIPAGWLVRICIRDGHRDPTVFDAPDAFDPDRFLARRYAREEYCPLGMFGHSCLGAGVIDLIAPLFVEQLAARYDLAVRADGPREYGRAHWQPSSRLRLTVTPRSMS